jgi:hypothetical protein
MTTARDTGGGVRHFARRSADWLRGCLLLPPVVPQRLVAVLVVWPVLLLSFFVLPEARYLNVPPFLAGANASAGNGGQPAVPLQVTPRKLAVLVLPMERDTTANDVARDRNIDLIRERVGTNILVAAGYLSDAYYVPDETGYPPRPYYVLQPNWVPSGCASQYEVRLPAALDSAEIQKRVPHLALAIVAIEKFNRNALHRAVERTYAELHRRVSGRLPDLSFGPAQIRLSLLRRIAAERPDWPTAAAWSTMSDDQLLDRLWQECEALKMVATVLLHGLAAPQDPACKDDGCPDPEQIVIEAYAGQRPRRRNAPIDYVGIVQAMTRMMEASLPETTQ